MFLNRDRELKHLQDIHDRKGAQFVVLYGRRRIGKTALIQHWLGGLKKTPTLHWTAYKTSSTILLERFSEAVTSQLGSLPKGTVFDSWESAIEHLFEVSRSQRVVVAIDEFPYLVEAVPEISSLIQVQWDHKAKKSQLALLLCGSQYNMMVDEFLSGKRPLFGRSTANILLREIDPASLSLFLPRYSPAQIVETYSIIGGVPKYLELWDDGCSVAKNLEEMILSPVSIFKQEAIFLIQDEIAEPRTYFAILEAIGAGLKTPTQIAEITGTAINHMGKYLGTLLSFDLIRRVHSLEDAGKGNARSGRYEIRDPFLRFHFTYLHPNAGLIERDRQGRLLEIILESFDSFVGKTGYEELCRRRITEEGNAGRLPFNPEDVGRLWNRSLEIDIAAHNRKASALLVGECKWKRTKMDTDVADGLIAKAEKLTKWKDYHKTYSFFSKSGFTKKMLKRAMDDHFLLFEGPEMERVEP